MAVVDCQFLVLTTDFEMSETCELLSWYLHGCIYITGQENRSSQLNGSP